tara:strand:+ start:77 stop:919 length:843 start_codon:yes stop_codon:yes gene_type:complete
MSLFLGGCATQERVIRDTWGDFERSVKGKEFNYTDRETEQSRRMAGKTTMLDNNDTDPLADPNRQASRESWSILLASFASMDQQKQAQEMLEQLKRHNINDAWMAQQDGYTHVYRGKFNDPTLPAVQSALRQSRMIKLGDDRPFEAAHLVAARPALEISSSDMDLKRYRDQGLYSLQVAVYDDTAGPNYQRLAEEGAANLRKDGDQAFYYHGKFRSMVTIGLFSYDEAWTKRINVSDVYSSRILDLQKKYPYNLFNGRTIIEKSDGKKVREQPSFLVQIR